MLLQLGLGEDIVLVLVFSKSHNKVELVNVESLTLQMTN